MESYLLKIHDTARNRNLAMHRSHALLKKLNTALQELRIDCDISLPVEELNVKEIGWGLVNSEHWSIYFVTDGFRVDLLESNSRICAEALKNLPDLLKEISNSLSKDVRMINKMINQIENDC